MLQLRESGQLSSTAGARLSVQLALPYSCIQLIQMDLQRFSLVTPITSIFLNPLLSSLWTNSPAIQYPRSSTASSNLFKERFPCLSNCRRNISAVSCAVTAASPYAFRASFRARTTRTRGITIPMTRISSSSRAFSSFVAVLASGNQSTPSTRLWTALLHSLPRRVAWPERLSRAILRFPI